MKQQTKAKGRSALQALSRAYKAGGPRGVGRVLHAGGQARKRAQTETKTVDTSFLGTDQPSTAIDIQRVFSNLAGTTTAIGTNVPWLQHINLVPAGTSASQRVGKRIKMQNILIRATFAADNNNTTAVCAATANRLIAATRCSALLIYDRKPATPTNWPKPSEIFSTTGSAAAGAPLTLLDTAPRFKVLKRWDFNIGLDYNLDTVNGTTICLWGAGSNGSVPPIKAIDEMVSLHGLETEWTAGSTAGTYNEIVAGGLLLVFMGEFAQDATQITTRTAGNPYVRTLTTRLYYKDP